MVGEFVMMDLERARKGIDEALYLEFSIYHLLAS
jgi:hypothetical protein